MSSPLLHGDLYEVDIEYGPDAGVRIVIPKAMAPANIESWDVIDLDDYLLNSPHGPFSFPGSKNRQFHLNHKHMVEAWFVGHSGRLQKIPPRRVPLIHDVFDARRST